MCADSPVTNIQHRLPPCERHAPCITHLDRKKSLSTSPKRLLSILCAAYRLRQCHASDSACSSLCDRSAESFSLAPEATRHCVPFFPRQTSQNILESVLSRLKPIRTSRFFRRSQMSHLLPRSPLPIDLRAVSPASNRR